ncbi:unnamed protein product, partial [Sphacelaria rigidula]
EDNLGVIRLAKNQPSRGWSQHIDVRHHYLCELIGDGKVRFQYIPSQQQHADYIPKALPEGSFQNH